MCTSLQMNTYILACLHPPHLPGVLTQYKALHNNMQWHYMYQIKQYTRIAVAISLCVSSCTTRWACSHSLSNTSCLITRLKCCYNIQHLLYLPLSSVQLTSSCVLLPNWAGPSCCCTFLPMRESVWVPQGAIMNGFPRIDPSVATRAL